MVKEKEKRTELQEFGEFGLIKHLTRNIKLKNPSSLRGVGDDAAVIDNGDKVTLVSTDLLIEGVHFDLSYTPLKHLKLHLSILKKPVHYILIYQKKQAVKH